jgi:hypothetical protein
MSDKKLYYYDRNDIRTAALNKLAAFDVSEVCMDLAQYNYPTFEEAVDAVVFDTLVWEGIIPT